MGIDWSRRQGSMGGHKHFPSDIIDPATAEPDTDVGAPQRVSLLGPYPITFQTPGLINPINAGIEVGPEIAAGSIILQAWIANTGDNWVADSVHWLQIAYGSAANATQVVTIDGDTGNNDPRGYQPFPLSTDIPANLVPWVTRVVGKLVVSWNDVTNAHSGEGDVYALIATPSV